MRKLLIILLVGSLFGDTIKIKYASGKIGNIKDINVIIVFIMIVGFVSAITCDDDDACPGFDDNVDTDDDGIQFGERTIIPTSCVNKMIKIK